MGFKKNNPGCKCCGACIILEDVFDRASIGADWSVQSGSWSIGSSAVATSDANAYLRCEIAHPDAIAEHYVKAVIDRSLGSATAGDKARIILCETLAAEIEFGSTTNTCSYVRLFNGSTIVGEYRLRISIGSVYFWAGYSATTGVLWATLTSGASPTSVRLQANVGTVTGTKVGIGTGDVVDGTITFSEFMYGKHNYGTTVTTCYEPTFATGGLSCEFAPPWVSDDGTAVVDIGCDWNIKAGSWDVWTSGVDLNTYILTNDANALVESAVDQSELNCTEHTDYGYHKFATKIQINNAGDIARVYLDWDGTNGNYVEFVARGTVGGTPVGGTSFYRGGTLLEYVPVVGLAAGILYTVTVCTSLIPDGSGMSNISVRFSTSAPVTTDAMVSVTTIYGNKRVAFGTGGTVTGNIMFKQCGASANINDCETCVEKECEYCPGGDTANQGYSIAITGFARPYGAACDCTTYNATYVVTHDSTSMCTGTWPFTGVCFISPFNYVDLYVGWAITAVSGGWRLTVTITAYSPLWSPYHQGGPVYYKDFTMSQRCDTISGETLTFDSLELASDGDTPVWCDNLSGLTVTVTSVAT